MNNKYVYFDLCEEFKKHDEYKDINGELFKSAIISKIKELDQKTISIILSFPEIINKFTKKLNNIVILDQQSLLSFFQSREFINNSFTEYTNKIGLTNGLKFLDHSDEVVLDFPYKDCILLGNQSKEENEGVRQKFFHEVINFQEIDRLFTKKVLCNFQKHTKDGVIPISDFKETDNLVIKGNNLIALHTIKEKFAGKVKLIYIDPPYNTESLKFAYNDKFNQATWLTFMKNRLEVAKSLLRDDGVISVQIDGKQVHYLRLLLDNIFGQDNFVSMISVRMSNESGPKMAHVEKTIPKIAEFILIYKNKDIFINPAKMIKKNWDNEYKYILSGYTEEIDKLIKENDFTDNKNLDEINKNLKNCFLINYNEYFKNNNIIFKSDEEKQEWLYKNNFFVFRDSPADSLKKIADKKIYDQKISLILSNDGLPSLIRTDYNKNADNPRIQLVQLNNSITLGDMWTDIGTTGLHNEGGVTLKNGKKPEYLLQRIISMFSKENDIILDYHLGSGTTCAVTHKMGRQYIGIEQLDYGQNDSIVRLKKVLNGENGGISPFVDWQGGGEFISMNIYSLVDEILNKIKQARTQSEINDIISLLLSEKYFYYLGINENKIPYEEIFTNSKYNFKNLSIDEQKRILHASIDKNNIYVDLNDLYDNTVNLSKEEKELNEKFYKDNK